MSDESVGGGAALLDELRATLTRYVVFPNEHAASATALWIATTHALPAFECAPRLVITSPQKRCGKTRLLDIIDGTCHSPLATSDATVAAVFRSLGCEHPPTLILDEADAIWGTKKLAEQNEDLRKLINAGHQRGKPALRCVGPNQIPTKFPVFAMAALAGIGSLPDTITDRAVNLTMARRSSGERVAQYRSRRDGPRLASLRDRLAAWLGARIEELAKAEPRMPVEDRAADTWEPLVAVADAAGGHWRGTARAACKALVDAAAQADQDKSLNTKLLADVRDVFNATGAPFLKSTELVAELRRIEESPWEDFDLTARKLASRLKDYGVEPKPDTTGKVRGYRLDGLRDAFARYLAGYPSESVKPSETTPDLEKRSDTSDPSDGSKCQTGQKCQTETAGQTPFLTLLTGSDGYPAENGRTAPKSSTNGQPPGALSPSSPGQTDRVASALARAKTERDARYRNGVCVDCGERPHSAGRPRCNECHRIHAQVVNGYEH